MEDDGRMADWVEEVSDHPLRFHLPESSNITVLFSPADAYLDDRSAFIAAVTPWIQTHRNLVDARIDYSEDRRGFPAPYFVRESGSLVVGFFDGEYGDMARHKDEVEACVDYIYREAFWVLRRRRVM